MCGLNRLPLSLFLYFSPWADQRALQVHPFGGQSRPASEAANGPAPGRRGTRATAPPPNWGSWLFQLGPEVGRPTAESWGLSNYYRPLERQSLKCVHGLGLAFGAARMIELLPAPGATSCLLGADLSSARAGRAKRPVVSAKRAHSKRSPAALAPPDWQRTYRA